MRYQKIIFLYHEFVFVISKYDFLISRNSFFDIMNYVLKSIFFISIIRIIDTKYLFFDIKNTSKILKRSLIITCHCHGKIILSKYGVPLCVHASSETHGQSCIPSQCENGRNFRRWCAIGMVMCEYFTLNYHQSIIMLFFVILFKKLLFAHR